MDVFRGGSKTAVRINAARRITPILARQSLEEALSILRQSDDQEGLAWSLQYLGLVLASEGEYGLADSIMKDGVDIARKLGDLNKGIFSITFMGDNVLHLGDRREAKRVYEESASLLRRVSNGVFEAYPQRRLGYLALEDNDSGQAWRYFQKSLVLNLDLGDQRGAAGSLNGMAALALHMNQPLVAARLIGFVESQFGSPQFPFVVH
jgi:tetratricopeptide (TPR) repeat protein